MSKINSVIFRSYDIRGLVEQDLTSETVELIGRGFGTYIQKVSGREVVVGGDNRSSTETFRQALIKGLLATGCQVTDIGVSMTPMLWFANFFYRFSGGIQITGSHNPIEFNGFKLVKSGIDALAGEEIQEIKKIIEQTDFILRQGQMVKKEIFSDYLEEIKKRIKLARPIKAVVDCGNGTGSFFIPKILQALGLELTELYCQSDPTFPNHLPDPEDAKNMTDLIRLVKEKKAEIGLAFDGDCDRIGIVDEKGKRYEADELMLILARDLLSRKPGAKIVVDVKYSQLVIDKIKSAGGEVVIWKTGYPNIKSKMTEVGSLLAGEVSGHMFLKENYFGYDDATFAALKILEIFSKTKELFSTLLSDLPKIYSTPELKLPCADERKFVIVSEIINYFKDKYQSILVDGIRLMLKPDAWALIRCSNTNPYLTVRFEARNKSDFNLVKGVVANKLREYPEIDLRELIKLSIR